MDNIDALTDKLQSEIVNLINNSKLPGTCILYILNNLKNAVEIARENNIKDSKREDYNNE